MRPHAGRLVCCEEDDSMVRLLVTPVCCLVVGGAGWEEWANAADNVVASDDVIK